MNEQRQTIHDFKTSTELGKVDEASSTLLIGSSAASVQLRERLARAATTDLSVLLTGETGVGKEIVAREIHRLAQASDYRTGPFVVMDCANVPAAQAEAVLFGQVAGAFAGTEPDRKGLFELADGGTLFIDGVNELSEALQAKLLRALEEREVTRVGSQERLAVDFRVIAAARGSLATLRDADNVRVDLYYRIGEYVIEVPPLRVRRDDIRPLADHFLAELGTGQQLTPLAYQALEQCTWPGNVRELRSVIRRAALLHADKTILEPDALFENQLTEAQRDSDLGRLLDYDWEHAKEEFGRWYWTNVWHGFGGDKQKVVEHTRVSQVWLRNRRKIYELHDSVEAPS